MNTQPVLTEEQAIARRLGEATFSVKAAYFDQKRKYCWKNIDALVSNGLFGMTLPYEFGGKSASLYETVIVAEELARHCALTARAFVEANMGATAAIMAYGTKAQKERCASLILNGDKPALCLDEEISCIEAEDIRTTAIRVGDNYVLNGVKRAVSGGGVSKVHLIVARIIDEEGTDQSIGAFLTFVDRDKHHSPKGFKITGYASNAGLCGMPETHLEFDDFKVSASMRLETPLDEEGGCSELLTLCRAQEIGFSAIALGAAAGALDDVKAHLQTRLQPGRLIAERQGLMRMVADMDVTIQASRLMLHDAAKSAGPIGQFLPDPANAARAKLFASESAMKVANQALQLFGAGGYGVESKIERIYRDVYAITTDGAADLLRAEIARSSPNVKPLPLLRESAKTESSDHFVEAAE